MFFYRSIWCVCTWNMVHRYVYLSGYKRTAIFWPLNKIIPRARILHFLLYLSSDHLLYTIRVYNHPIISTPIYKNVSTYSIDEKKITMDNSKIVTPHTPNILYGIFQWRPSELIRRRLQLTGEEWEVARRYHPLWYSIT